MLLIHIRHLCRTTQHQTTLTEVFCEKWKRQWQFTPPQFTGNVLSRLTLFAYLQGKCGVKPLRFYYLMLATLHRQIKCNGENKVNTVRRRIWNFQVGSCDQYVPRKLQVSVIRQQCKQVDKYCLNLIKLQQSCRLLCCFKVPNQMHKYSGLCQT